MGEFLSTLPDLVLWGMLLALGGGVGAAVTYYFAAEAEKAQLRKQAIELSSKVSNHDREIADLKSNNEEIEQKRKRLLEDNVQRNDRGLLYFSLIQKLRERLDFIREQVNAERATLYLPALTKSGEFTNLFVFEVSPYDGNSRRILHQIVPRKSSAGRSFELGESRILSPKDIEESHYKQADTLTSYSSRSIMNLVVRHRGEKIALLQFLDSSESAFDATMLKVASELLGDFSESVFEVSRNHQLQEYLGVYGKDLFKRVPVLVCDISHSFSIFDEMVPSEAVDLIDRYLHEMVDSAFSRGGVLANYTGDGVIVFFDQGAGLEGNLEHCLRAASDMNRRFERLKQEWCDAHPQLGITRNRCAIAAGRVAIETIGHRQLPRQTVIGRPVSIASYISDAAPRDRNTICISSDLKASLPQSAKVLNEFKFDEGVRFGEGYLEIAPLSDRS